MDGKRALYYGAIATAILVALFAISTVVSVLIGVTLWAISWAINLAVVVAVLYAVYKVWSWLLSDDEASPSASVDGEPESAQDRLRRQYVEGEIDEAEFERQIGAELETEPLDDIDRELEREREPDRER
jgi:uncharacterized membrane protein